MTAQTAPQAQRKISKPEVLFVVSSHPAKLCISCPKPHRIAISRTLQTVFRTAGR